jgi:GR25 family glycosyltransferase involved in LPS biosynthesis
MIAYIISLINSDRRKIATARAVNLNLKFEFFDAVDGISDENIPSILQVNNEVFKRRYKVRRDFLSRELGALLSHQNLYRKIKSLNNNCGPYLILEDDFFPLLTYAELEKIRNFLMDSKIDLLILGYSRVDNRQEAIINYTNPLFELKKIPGTKFHIGERSFESTCGSVAYFASQSFINRMSKDIELARLSDDWNYHKSIGIRINHITPLCFREDYTNLKSSVDFLRKAQGIKKPKQLPAAIKPFWRFLYRIFNIFKYKINKIITSK